MAQKSKKTSFRARQVGLKIHFR